MQETSRQRKPRDSGNDAIQETDRFICPPPFPPHNPAPKGLRGDANAQSPESVEVSGFPNPSLPVSRIRFPNLCPESVIVSFPNPRLLVSPNSQFPKSAFQFPNLLFPESWFPESGFFWFPEERFLVSKSALSSFESAFLALPKHPLKCLRSIFCTEGF